MVLGLASLARALDPRIGYLSQYAADIWMRRDGLPANTVTALAQTTDGYLWVGTPAGLVRFDGIRFARVPVGDTSNSPAFITALTPDRDGSLWVGTKTNGIRHIVGGTLQTIPPLGHAANITGITIAPDHSVFVGCDDGLYRLKGADGTRGSTASAVVTPLQFDSDGNLWTVTPIGVQVLGATGEVRRDIKLPGYCEAVRICRNGRVLLGTYDGLLEWQRDGVQPLAAIEPALNEHVKALLDDQDGNVWLATTEGITRVQFESNGRIRVSRFRVPGGALSLAEDREGSLWVGCVDGLRRLKNARAVVWGAPEGVPGNFSPSVLAANGKVLIFSAGANGGITEIVDGETRRFSNIPDGPGCVGGDGSVWISSSGVLRRIKDGSIEELGAGQGVPQMWISALVESEPGELLMTVDKTGVRSWRNGRNSPYLLRDGTAFTSPVYVMSAHKDPAGVIWMGTYDGLWRLDRGEITRYTTSVGETSNREWYRDHPQSATWFKTVVTDDLPDYWISSEDDDGHGTLWLGSNRGGLARLRDGRFCGFTTRDGLPTNEIFSVQLDGHGNVWIGTPTGIFELLADDLERVAGQRGEKLHPVGFSTLDGMRSEECLNVYHPASARSADGRLWFTTRDGVVSIDPDQRHANAAPPLVHIEEIRIDGVPAAPSAHVRVPPGYNKLEIHFTAPSLAAPERVGLKYRLEGYDESWLDATRERTAYYTRLKPGAYRFRAMAANEDGVWNQDGASVEIELLPFFYQTTWFAFVAGASLLVVAAGIHLWRVRHLRRREAELESRVAARTRELSGANDALKKEISERQRAEAEVVTANRELIVAAHRAGMAEVAEDVLHNVGNAVTSVNVSAELVRRIVQRNTVTRLDRVADLLAENAGTLDEFFGPSGKGNHLPKYLRALAAELTNERAATAKEISRLQEYISGIIGLVGEQQHLAGIGGADEPIDLRDIVRQTLQLRQPALARDNISVETELAEEVPLVRAERYKILEITTNLLDYGCVGFVDSTQEHKRIVIRVAAATDGVRLSIMDNGPTRDLATLKELFVQSLERGAAGHRHRMHVTAVLVKKMGGTVTVEAAPASGTLLVIHFPATPEPPRAAPSSAQRDAQPSVSALGH